MPYMPIMLKGLRIQGSVVAARSIHRKMLDFAALHNIKPIINTFPMTQAGIEQAFERLSRGEMRYRGVLVVEN